MLEDRNPVIKSQLTSLLKHIYLFNGACQGECARCQDKKILGRLSNFGASYREAKYMGQRENIWF